MASHQGQASRSPAPGLPVSNSVEQFAQHMRNGLSPDLAPRHLETAEKADSNRFDARTILF